MSAILTTLDTIVINIAMCGQSVSDQSHGVSVSSRCGRGDVSKKPGLCHQQPSDGPMPRQPSVSALSDISPAIMVNERLNSDGERGL